MTDFVRQIEVYKTNCKTCWLQGGKDILSRRSLFAKEALFEDFIRQMEDFIRQMARHADYRVAKIQRMP